MIDAFFNKIAAGGRPANLGRLAMSEVTLREIRSLLSERTVRGENFPATKPLISHYCSTSTLESILKYRQIWLSNPLLMNDLEELRFGMLTGRERFRSNEQLKVALGSQSRYNDFKNPLENLFDGFAKEGAFDVYIACFAQHRRNDDDGLLSMWRGYGANGNGACIVFDTSELNEVDESPLIIGKVEYASRNERIEWIDGIIATFAEILQAHSVPDEELRFASWILFERLLIFTLYTKHSGFHEEQEWRIVYMQHRDQEGLLAKMLDYHIGPRGAEPKLKFDIAPLKGVADEAVLIDKIVHKIILGPTSAADIHRLSVARMLERIGRGALVPKLLSSTIPYRAA
jgi:hypothetical protein